MTLRMAVMSFDWCHDITFFLLWCITAGRRHYLLPSEGDHVQRAVHEASHHHLGPVLREHGVIHTMVGCHILMDKGGQRQNKTN